MEKKNIIKLLLVSVAVIGLIYLIVDQFKKVGTASGKIDYYDLSAEILLEADNLPSDWVASSNSSFRTILSDIDIAHAMQGIGDESSDKAKEKACSVFIDAANSYFKKSTWSEKELANIRTIATYLHAETIGRIVDGYYSAKKVIASSKSCTSQTAVDNCIKSADTYNKTPWINCSEIKNGLASVRTDALNSYTNKTLIPICNRLLDFKSHYKYFDEFDEDYQKVKDGQDYLQKKNHTNSTFNTKFSSINYNEAANTLDPRF